jgi:FixJ family two-component response regulator
MTEPLPTVFVVDDDASVRKSLVRLLKSSGYRTESFASADEFFDCWKKNPGPGCVLLDIQMPGLDGLQLQQQLQTSADGIPIIFITGHGDIPSSVKAMKAGAVDFFPKPFNGEDLLQAVREAIQRDHRERRERAERTAVAGRYETLTPREREVMALVVRGMLNKQIASALGASEKTIKIHRGRVMEKMKAQSVADLVRAAEKINMPLGGQPANT